MTKEPVEHDQSPFDPAAFQAFEAASNDKALTAAVLARLLDQAIGTGLVLTGKGSLDFYVPGIGDGLQTGDYAQQLHKATGRRLRIWSDEPSAELAAQARLRLSALSCVDGVEITVGDAFAPTAFAAPRVDLAELSHMLYYVPERATVSRLVTTIAQRLSPNGLALFIHDTPDTHFTELLTRYSPLVLPDPVPAIAEAAAALSLPLFCLNFTPHVRFEDPGLLDQLRQKEPDEPELLNTARVVSCLCQRGIAELRRLGLWEEALRDVRRRLDPEGRLPIPATVQMMPAPALAADGQAIDRLGKTIIQTASQLRELEQQSRDFNSPT